MNEERRDRISDKETAERQYTYDPDKEKEYQQEIEDSKVEDDSE
ncbi:MAG: hypothetical protein QOH70_3757 [Blastocatellia bacterium]|jgi:hypothetical protein|nr:hypothetical protein [Blastocatellia bacterium]